MNHTYQKHWNVLAQVGDQHAAPLVLSGSDGPFGDPAWGAMAGKSAINNGQNIGKIRKKYRKSLINGGWVRQDSSNCGNLQLAMFDHPQSGHCKWICHTCLQSSFWQTHLFQISQIHVLCCRWKKSEMRTNSRARSAMLLAWASVRKVQFL